ncbi:MAG: hypothetical protein LQ338_002481 [Usnochroma carphineum]|nr:MAG: hypothetical protein LQ338_002481 [Usnochroma carphineum]
MSRRLKLTSLPDPLARSRRLPSIILQQRYYATSDRTSDKVPTNDPDPPDPVQNVSETNETPLSPMGLRDKPFQEMVPDSERQRKMQAPNRAEPWSRSQMPRERAMSGPRFEQTIMEYQPQPQAAIELIHKQPVRWTEQRVVSCDGGGGVLGHPRIFINVDKPHIHWCTYCGLPFAHEQHRKYLQSLPSTTFPLEPQGQVGEVPQSQSVTGEPFEQR